MIKKDTKRKPRISKILISMYFIRILRLKPLLNLRASWGEAYRPPPLERKFLITFDRLKIFPWNLDSVPKLWIDTFWQNLVIRDDVIATWWRHQISTPAKIGPPSNFFSLSYFWLKFCVPTPFDIRFWGWGSFFATCCIRVFYRPARSSLFCLIWAQIFISQDWQMVSTWNLDQC